MGARRPNSKEEMSHSDLAAGEKKTNRVHLLRKTARSSSPMRGIHYPENTFKISPPTKRLEKKIWALDSRGGKGAAGKDRTAETSE